MGAIRVVAWVQLGVLAYFMLIGTATVDVETLATVVFYAVLPIMVLVKTHKRK